MLNLKLTPSEAISLLLHTANQEYGDVRDVHAELRNSLETELSAKVRLESDLKYTNDAVTRANLEIKRLAGVIQALNAKANPVDPKWGMTAQEIASVEMPLNPDISGKICAIKMVRERTGLGLKEAKDIVDRYQFESGRFRKDDNGTWRVIS